MGSQPRLQHNGLSDLLLFGTATTKDDRTYVYKLCGKRIDGIYQLAFVVTDNTDDGTYISTFELQSVLDYFYSELSSSPSTLEGTLQWIKSAYGYLDEGSTATILTATSTIPFQVQAEYKDPNGEYTESLALPPLNRPLEGNIPLHFSRTIRFEIMIDLVKKNAITEYRLEECRKQKHRMEATVNDLLRHQAESSVERVMDVLRKMAKSVSEEKEEVENNIKHVSMSTGTKEGEGCPELEMQAVHSIGSLASPGTQRQHQQGSPGLSGMGTGERGGGKKRSRMQMKPVRKVRKKDPLAIGSLFREDDRDGDT